MRHFPPRLLSITPTPKKPPMHRLSLLSLMLLFLFGNKQAVDDFRHADAASVPAARVAVVVPAKAAPGQQGEYRAARETAQTITAMLGELGLDADVIDEDAIVGGALGQRRVVILPYNPTLGNDCAEVLARLVDSGGKLLVCYSLHPRLGTALGFGKAKYVQQQRAGQFAEMRFDALDIAGLPKSVRQASWNITTAEPAGYNARVIGRWFDDAGHPTGHPAMLLSDRGAFHSHIVLRDDHDGNKRLLATLLGRLAPPLWKQMAQTRLQRASQVGHCTSVEEVAAYAKTAGGDTAYVEQARQALKQANEHFAQGAYVQTVDLAQTAHDALVQVYLRAADSPPREGRAMWNHSGTGAYPGDWERSAKLLSENGLNMILPNMLWGGVAHYPSDVLPRSATFRQYGDQIEQCCAAAKKHGIEVHVWKVNYNLNGAPKEFVEKVRREGRTQVAVKGQSSEWLCPSHPENQKLELESMLEVARRYPVDGLHFDYIRYPDGAHCYCDGCRRRFETQSGRAVSDWPKECFSGSRKEEYRDWRCRQITTLVAAVSREARKIRPGLKISAAVFGAYPDCRKSIGQDWPEWIKAGYLDFVCPMNYTANDAAFLSLIRSQTKLIEGRAPLYPGIGASVFPGILTADRVVGQIYHARSLGAAGFTIFDFNSSTAASVVPGVGLGAGARRAVPPHHAR